MHRIVKKTLQYTGFLFLSLIVLLIAGISYLYFSADMQTPKHEQSMTTDTVSYTHLTLPTNSRV